MFLFLIQSFFLIPFRLFCGFSFVARYVSLNTFTSSSPSLLFSSSSSSSSLLPCPYLALFLSFHLPIPSCFSSNTLRTSISRSPFSSCTKSNWSFSLCNRNTPSHSTRLTLYSNNSRTNTRHPLSYSSTNSRSSYCFRTRRTCSSKSPRVRDSNIDGTN